MTIKILMLVIFFGVMLAIGFYCRKHATDVNGFVLGGRSVGPWLTAFAYGTSYFSAVIFVGYAGQFGWKYGIASTWIGIGNALLGSMLAFRQCNHAGILWNTFPVQEFKDCGIRDRICIPDSLYGITLQRIIQTVWNGVPY